MKTVIAALLLFTLIGCKNYERNIPPNYDHLVGKNFSDTIFKGRQVYKVVRESGGIEELQDPNNEGCTLIFLVRKNDDIITGWRVDSGPGTCYTSKDAFNV